MKCQSEYARCSLGLRTIEMLPLATIAERLHYSGRDWERSVRRLFQRHGVPMIKRDAVRLCASSSAACPYPASIIIQESYSGPHEAFSDFVCASFTPVALAWV